MTDRTVLNAGKCPTGCGRNVSLGKLLCSVCWARVPGELQSRVYKTWRAWRKDFGDGDAMEAYGEAKEAAIASIA